MASSAPFWHQMAHTRLTQQTGKYDAPSSFFDWPTPGLSALCPNPNDASIMQPSLKLCHLSYPVSHFPPTFLVGGRRWWASPRRCRSSPAVCRLFLSKVASFVKAFGPSFGTCALALELWCLMTANQDMTPLSKYPNPDMTEKQNHSRS